MFARPASCHLGFLAHWIKGARTCTRGAAESGVTGYRVRGRLEQQLVRREGLLLGLRTRTVFYGLRYVTVRAVTVTYGSLEQRFYGRFHTGRNRIRSIGYVPYTAAYGIRLFLP